MEMLSYSYLGQQGISTCDLRAGIERLLIIKYGIGKSD